MKLIVVGSTGFVGTEVIRQAIVNPSVTSVVALARRPTPLPQTLCNDADAAAKLRSVVCEDFTAYSETVRRELTGADSCIWLMAVTPSKARALPEEQVRKICLDYTMAGLEMMASLPRNKDAKPFRFVYTSGSSAERDPTKKPWILGDYCLMRGQVETRVLDFVKSTSGAIEACMAKPGLIRSSEQTGLIMESFQAVACSLISLPIIELSDMSAALLNQALKGIDKEILVNEDLVRIGKRELAEQQSSQ